MRSNALLAVIAATGLLLTACGSDGSVGSDDSDAPAASEAPADTETPAATEAPADSETPADTPADSGATGGEAMVSIAADPDLGDILVDSGGFTLYLFDQDQGTTTACTGACAANWPPLVAADGAPAAGDGVDAAELSTADGIEPNQVTYHGRLLYYFAGDQSPGDTNGADIPSWFAVTPSGDPAVAPAGIGY